MQLNLYRLWIFMTVVEEGGFSAAANKLYLSQPSVSNQVRQLEQALRTTLIDRSGARIRLTPEGEVLLEYAKRVFLLADEAVAAIRQVSGLQSGTLVAGGSTTVGTYLLPPMLAAFQAEHPGIDVGIFVGNAEQVERRLVDGEVGVAVLAGLPKAPQLVSEPILQDRIVLITPPDHPLVGSGWVEPERLAGERFLLREPGSSTRAVQEEALAAWGLDEAQTAEIYGPETIKQSVAAGLGISLVSEHCVESELALRRLAVIDVTMAPEPRPIVFAHRRDRLLGPAEEEFIKLLRDVHTWPAHRPLRAVPGGRTEAR
ncbi:MAG: LysR family transcriptional regulator, low CO2-responsive transcriptional regulator [Streptosporangiaceae bacterium]|nr:LysR family transcriptional regulator [Streptosporangiaceae bacterium]MDX6429372.1 LysR family transcriptional regulator, low CO2-responsive transcriptional regulator [Streptosporangiaceae bacterium]